MPAWTTVARITMAFATAVACLASPAAAQRIEKTTPPTAWLLPDAPAPVGSALPESEGDTAKTPVQADRHAAQEGMPAPTSQPEAKQDREKARQQLKAEEKQRVLGVVPNFGTTYLWDAASLSAGQKIQLAFRSAIDPFTFVAAALVASGHELFDDEPGFQWGAAGFGQRVGAAYLDAVDGDMIGNGFLPALLHQDPRYFRLGHGSFRHRLFYAVAATVVCRGDNGRSQPSISNVGGNLAAGAISNFYYPNQNAGWGQTVGNGLIVTAEGTAGGIFQEFWPDISRKLLHKDPSQPMAVPAVPGGH